MNLVGLENQTLGRSYLTMVRNLLWVGKVESGLQRIFQKALCLRKNPLVALVGLHLRPKLRKMNPPTERWAIFLKGKVISIRDRTIEGI